MGQSLKGCEFVHGRKASIWGQFALGQERSARALCVLGRETSAQGTFEYAVVCSMMLVIILGLAVLWRASAHGGLSALVEQAASHAAHARGVPDLVLY
ncbi:hypothetical protein KPC83_06410 [Collinsella sp. zg1085]|uniref:hypothetical protein n=1 Tax=Collinsella sp. zg1085 TaxID=2844380 RepID=UPI001C0ADECA|nr:hypothetical protein [Collinsella sp. zg1085]QWT17463.1 hypothetical protein KPC83_06410 [Collinsella sp. zg1085]